MNDVSADVGSPDIWFWFLEFQVGWCVWNCRPWGDMFIMCPNWQSFCVLTQRMCNLRVCNPIHHFSFHDTAHVAQCLHPLTENTKIETLQTLKLSEI